ncbi:hypothetical protein [Kineococcus rubinsiae]|uniref:hypothetical protein n=1 Tax=Kineococcus rubinsiae TaxID=2609562 RepID=UPI001431CA0A|nr:hypothetical protein [Kineococcus rubinsiae]NIZ92181.1 hypothetical protein [Kineococcus rubinsiae]
MNTGRTRADATANPRSVASRATLLRGFRLPGRWTPALLGVIAVLSVLSVLSQVLKYGLDLDLEGLNSFERWFFVDREMGVPAWFSTILLFVAGERLWRLASHEKAAGSPWHRHWRLLSATFVYLSLDELTELHEQAILPLRALLDTSGVLTFAWVVLAVPLVAVFGLVFLRFLRAQSAVTRWTFVLSAVVYLGGAVGMEMAGSPLYNAAAVPVTTTVVTDGGTPQVSETVVVHDVPYAFVVGLEEGLEMLGALLFLGAVTTVAVEKRRSSPTALPIVAGAPVGRHVRA